MTSRYSSITHEHMTIAALTGSEKQIAWAESIRAKALNDLELRLSILINNGKVANVERSREQGRQMVELLSGKTEAKFWIDNRNSDFGRLAAQELTSTR